MKLKGNNDIISSVENKSRAQPGTRAFRRGMYSSTLTVIIIIIVILFNVILTQIPNNLTRFDMSKSQIYGLGSITSDILNELTEGVDIYIIGEEGSIDDRIIEIVDQYSQASEKINSDIVNIVDDPTFVASNDTAANSIMVKCETTGRQRTIVFSEIIRIDELL